MVTESDNICVTTPRACAPGEDWLDESKTGTIWLDSRKNEFCSLMNLIICEQYSV